MKIHFILNPSASSYTERTRVLVQRALSNEHEVQVDETERRGHATRFTQSAVAEGADAVVVLSGDGTLNEAANGLAGSNVALGAIPGGSTNVYARSLGFTNDPTKATGELLASMRANKKRRVSLGKANDRYFLFHVGVGFDAAVVGTVEKRSVIKRYAAHPYFVLSTLVTWARYTTDSGPRLHVEFPDDAGNLKTLDGYLTICMNSNPYTYLANRPLNVAPRANFEKGLVVLTVRKLDAPTTFGVITSALRSGRRMRDLERTDVRQQVKNAEVTADEDFPYQLDGEYLGEVPKLTLSHHANVLDVFVP